MIEFNGYLTGASEKFFFKKTATYAQNIWLFGFIGIFPLVIILMKFFRHFPYYTYMVQRLCTF